MVVGVRGPGISDFGVHCRALAVRTFSGSNLKGERRRERDQAVIMEIIDFDGRIYPSPIQIGSKRRTVPKVTRPSLA